MGFSEHNIFSHRRIFLIQRATAMVLAPLVVVHLLLIVLAVRNGLSGEEILSRTQGSFFWAVFYGLFVLAVSLHAPIGLRNVMREWTSISDRKANIVSLLFALLLLLTGLRAVVAVVGS